MKMLNATITDDAGSLLEKIKATKHFSNNAEALDWIIKHVAKGILPKEKEVKK